jgi:hypothetical protein
MTPIFDAPPAPRGLLYLATFSRRERAEITSSPHLSAAIRAGSPAEWPGIMRQHRETQRTAAGACVATIALDDDGLRQQALHDLQAAAVALAALTDNRRGQLFGVACRLAKYLTHGVLSEAETFAALHEAAASNGSLTRYGQRWADSTIRRALVAGRNDVLPPLARRFRTNGGRP